MRILLAEDDLTIAEHVKKSLMDAGYHVDHLASGPDVWETAETSEYSAVILDLGLPGMDGLSILKRWRNAGLETPVLVLTARGSWMERVDGFEAGADDYLPKPFRTEELLVRLKALLRRTRTSQTTANVRSAGRFTLNEATRRVTFDGRDIDLSPHEFRLVSYLMDRKGQVVGPLDLANHVQGRDDDTAKNAIEAMIGRLRRKTDMLAIETRRGFGYVIPENQAC